MQWLGFFLCLHVDEHAHNTLGTVDFAATPGSRAQSAQPKPHRTSPVNVRPWPAQKIQLRRDADSRTAATACLDLAASSCRLQSHLTSSTARVNSACRDGLLSRTPSRTATTVSARPPRLSATCARSATSILCRSKIIRCAGHVHPGKSLTKTVSTGPLVAFSRCALPFSFRSLRVLLCPQVPLACACFHARPASVAHAYLRLAHRAPRVQTVCNVREVVQAMAAPVILAQINKGT